MQWKIGVRIQDSGVRRRRNHSEPCSCGQIAGKLVAVKHSPRSCLRESEKERPIVALRVSVETLDIAQPCGRRSTRFTGNRERLCRPRKQLYNSVMAHI